MTLVFGLANNEIGFLVADTKLTPVLDVSGNASGPVNGEFHTLKIHVLSPKLAVAFATSDDAEGCVRLIGSLHGQPHSNAHGQIANWIRENYWTSHDPKIRDSEFLVLSLEGKAKGLEKVTREGVKKGERFYIGDASAYAALRTLMQNAGANGHLSGDAEFEAVSVALEALVNDRRTGVGAVAGIVTRVVDARHSGDLEYMQSGETSVSPWEGSSGFTALTSNAETRGVGIYFRSGKLGYVMQSASVESCQVVRAASVEEFVEQARERFGMRLEGITW